MVSVKIIWILFHLHITTTTEFRVRRKLNVNALTNSWDNSQKIQQNTRGHPEIFGTGSTKFPILMD